MFRNKCVECEKTRSKCRYIGREGKYLCRKCYNKVKRESEKTLLVDDTVDAAVTAASNNPAEAVLQFIPKWNRDAAAIGHQCFTQGHFEKPCSHCQAKLPGVQDAIQEAIDKEFTIMLMIDDYHNIHTIRSPQEENGSNKVDLMCTIIIKILKEVPAIPFSSVNLIHNPCGIYADLLVNKLCSIQFFSQICTSSFALSMPEFTSFSFDPVMDRHQMESHDNQGASSLRSFKDVYLNIDFVKLPLKSKKNYEDAFEIVLNTNMREYLSKFIVLMPADWPGQYFPRQIVYQKVSQATAASNIPQGSCCHPLTSVIPTLGPLHVDLNADENIVLGYMPLLLNSTRQVLCAVKEANEEIDLFEIFSLPEVIIRTTKEKSKEVLVLPLFEIKDKADIANCHV
ncbi:uncharacterized protein LOC122953143 [Acropora millepora]|uniref:uncharacterized protein LOC122953143 n=1 Tax=Acropora millepora TaxID=45264 RepID=UPI001CF34DED|nr:uncharacterized protein LOC122953143 [Acropora millepora]